ncbi:MAG: putative sulfate exporter family transporter [Acidobacteria bacterium]|nr:putative sulfate exporter family transporter [Acidobacteriota bacterium]
MSVQVDSVAGAGFGFLAKVDSKIVFFVLLILMASGFMSPPVALLVGIVYGFSFVHPYHVESRKLSSLLLKLAVVGLGFGMNLRQVVHAGKAGFLYTAISISSVLVLGWVLGRVFRVSKKASYLITVGTAICGGSAIAAIAPITNPNEEEMAMSLGTVFVLNSVALLLFPPIGWALHLSQTQFGLWAALAIHDTSSVVGASAKYGAQALQIATTVKLTRALWIVPLAMVTAYFAKSKAKIQLPWFILYFCLAAVMYTYVPQGKAMYAVFSTLGKIGLTVVLFLIGTGLSKETLKKVGVRPLLQGVLLWAVVGVASLLAIRAGWIAL